MHKAAVKLKRSWEVTIWSIKRNKEIEFIDTITVFIAIVTIC